MICTHRISPGCHRFLVACSPCETCYSLRRSPGGTCPCPSGSMMSNGTSSAVSSEQDLASGRMAEGRLPRLVVARLKSAGVPVAPLLRRVGLTPELIADPEERLSVRSQITFLDEAAIALKDDCLGFTLARDEDPREIGAALLRRSVVADPGRCP